MAYAAISPSVDSRGTHSSAASAVPNASIIQVAMLWIEIQAAVVTSPRASSSKMSTASARVSPEPPRSSEA
jgi:hypothetical protein